MSVTARSVQTMAGDSLMNGSVANGSTMASRNDIDLHELAKGWKAAVARAADPTTRHEATMKNDRGNLPLHSAASFRAPIEVTGKAQYPFISGLSSTIVIHHSLLNSFMQRLYLRHFLKQLE